MWVQWMPWIPWMPWSLFVSMQNVEYTETLYSWENLSENHRTYLCGSFCLADITSDFPGSSFCDFEKIAYRGRFLSTVFQLVSNWFSWSYPIEHTVRSFSSSLCSRKRPKKQPKETTKPKEAKSNEKALCSSFEIKNIWVRRNWKMPSA